MPQILFYKYNYLIINYLYLKKVWHFCGKVWHLVLCGTCGIGVPQNQKHKIMIIN